MRALGCDRCGELYRKPLKWPAYQVHWQNLEYKKDKTKGHWFDLCPECQRELEDWIAMEEFPKEEYETEEDFISGTDA